MRKNNFLFLFLLTFFLIVTPLVVAAPPFSTTTTTVNQFSTGYVIRIPTEDYIVQEKNHEFVFHVFNISNGFPITDVFCCFHLYDDWNEHIYEKCKNTTAHVFDYEFTVAAKNFSKGKYWYNIQCNSTVLGGYNQDSFEATPMGVGEVTQYYWIIFALVAFVIVLGFWLEDGWIIILGAIGLIFVGFLIITQGIDLIKNTNFTYPLGLLTWGLAIYLMIRGAMEQLKD